MLDIKMFYILILTLFGVVLSYRLNVNSSLSEKFNSNNLREKRLLFYDEEGNLVKTYINPYLREVPQGVASVPSFGSYFDYFKPFFAFLRPPATFTGHASPYMIPLSEEVIQHVANDPVYQNKLIFRESIIEPNALLMTDGPLGIRSVTLCAGKRKPIPSLRHCSTFLNCWDGWAVEQECPDGLLFSEEGHCDYAYKVDCSRRGLRDDTLFRQKCKNDFEAFRNELNCNEFFICVGRTPVKFKCPADLFFNEKFALCDYPYKVECRSTSPVNHGSQLQDEPTHLSDPSMNATEVPSFTHFDSTSSADSNVEPPGIMMLHESTATGEKKTTMSKMSIEGWTHRVAISRQDAIRQLKIDEIAENQSGY